MIHYDRQEVVYLDNRPAGDDIARAFSADPTVPVHRIPPYQRGGSTKRFFFGANARLPRTPMLDNNVLLDADSATGAPCTGR